MKSNSAKSSNLSSSTTKILAVSLFFVSLTLILLSSKLKIPYRYGASVDNCDLHTKEQHLSTNVALQARQNKPAWFNFVEEDIEATGNNRHNNIKFGLVNVGEEEVEGLGESVLIHFDRVKRDVKWDDLFPEWIDEDQKESSAPTCPNIPMPAFDDHKGVVLGIDVVVARVPCEEMVGNDDSRGIRDVFRLQVNLVVANLLVNNVDEHGGFDRTVYVVFIGSCGAMLEIFRCDDLVWNEDEYWVYKPDLRRLKQKVMMPVGSCQLAPPYALPGKELWKKRYMPHSNENDSNSTSSYTMPREAYVTLLHSSEKYVCGAIALAQSLVQTKTTKELVILVDDSIKAPSLQGLRSAGWKIKKIKRIRSPHARKDAYNEWNYSKLRIFQMTKYDKIIFIDADLLVLRNMDELFIYPQLSARVNDGHIFNSGVMAIEPSECTFKLLMAKRHTISSYNGGDQGFLNEVFTWWHRWPKTVNALKFFNDDDGKNLKHEISDDLYAIHYLGLKPWMCYRDYDCNWDMQNHHIFASDMAHKRWWQVYDDMPRKLQDFCALTEHMDFRIRKWRNIAANASLVDGHWKIQAKDPRQYNLV